MKNLLDHRIIALDGLLDDEVKAALKDVESPRRYCAGELVFSQGDLAKEMMIIRKGSIRVRHLSADGREMTLAVLGPGQHLGLVGMMVGRRGQGAVATEDCDVGVISHGTFSKVLEQHPHLAVQLLPVVLSRLKAALNFIDDIKGLPISVHTAVILEQLLSDSAEPGVISWSQSDIALAVGASRVSVGKALKELEGMSLIQLRYAEILVPDESALSNWIDQHREELYPF